MNFFYFCAQGTGHGMGRIGNEMSCGGVKKNMQFFFLSDFLP
jgi:hypothetical protein